MEAELWTVVGWDPATAAGILDHVHAADPLSAALVASQRRIAAGIPEYEAAAVFRGRLRLAAAVQDADAGSAPPPVRSASRPFTVVAVWRGTGELLVPAGACVRASSGLEALGLVQLAVAPASLLRIVAALAGHQHPAAGPEMLVVNPCDPAMR